MATITLKIAQRALLAAIFVSTAAAAAPAEQGAAPQLAALNQIVSAGAAASVQVTPIAKAKPAMIACDVYEGTPDCHDGFMPLR